GCTGIAPSGAIAWEQVTVAPEASGTFPVVLTAEASAPVGVELEVQDPVVPPGSTPPVADAGGPYVVAGGSRLVLDASASTDVDGAVAIARWDLDDDGAFDDAVAHPQWWPDATGTFFLHATLPWAIPPAGGGPTVVDDLCGGTCTNG